MVDDVRYVANLIDRVAKFDPNMKVPNPTDLYDFDDEAALELVLEDDLVRPCDGYIEMRDVYLVNGRTFVAIHYYVGHPACTSKAWFVMQVERVETTRFANV